MKKNGDGYGTGDNRREEIKETRKEKDEGDESEVWEVMQEERKGMKRGLQWRRVWDRNIKLVQQLKIKNHLLMCC